jgi:hypothetical protein
VVTDSPIMSSGLPNTGHINGVGTSSIRPGLNLRLGMKDRYKVKIGHRMLVER